MTVCDQCERESDVVVPVAVDYDVGEPVNEDWCPVCCVELITDEAYGVVDENGKEPS